METNKWKNLVVETQFATELTMTGLRRLCAVPTDPALAKWGSDDLNYALHVGMYSYASGLERLGKLAIACHGYVTTGKFTKVSGFGHRIGDLLDAVEELDLTDFTLSTHKEKYLTRPTDVLDPDLTNMIERFAAGAGRYEHLDSLSNDRAEVNTYKEWSELAERASVSEEIQRLISLKTAVTDVIKSELIDAELESTSQSVIDDLEIPTYEPSVGVVLSMFRTVRWVSTVLHTVSHYTGKGLPILGEVVSPTFIQSSENFFNFHIARFSDDGVIAEELQEAYERIHAREAELDDEDSEEVGVGA